MEEVFPSQNRDIQTKENRNSVNTFPVSSVLYYSDGQRGGEWTFHLKAQEVAVRRVFGSMIFQRKGVRRCQRVFFFRAFRIRNKGQVTTELILLGVVLIVLAQLVINQIKNNKYMEDFAKGPSQVLANMISNGNWKKNPEDSKNEHPNSHGRHYSWD